jgi:hypothetical protein
MTRTTASLARHITQDATDRAQAYADRYPEQYTAARLTIIRLSDNDPRNADAATLALLLLPAFLTTGQEHDRRHWTRAARAAFRRFTQVLADAADWNTMDPADFRDDTVTAFPTYAPNPADAYNVTARDRIAAALLALDPEHREPMRRAAIAVLHGDRTTLTGRDDRTTTRDRVAAAVSYLRSHRAHIERNPFRHAGHAEAARQRRDAVQLAMIAHPIAADLRSRYAARAATADRLTVTAPRPQAADWTTAGPIGARHALRDQDAHDWTPGRSTGHRTTGAQPLGSLALAAVRPHTAPGARGPIPAARITAALARHTEHAAAVTAAQARPAHLRSKATEAEARGLHRAAARLTRTATAAALITGTESGYAPAPEPTATHGAHVTNVPATMTTVRPVTAHTLPTVTPMPEPDGASIVARLHLLTARQAAPTGTTLRGTAPLPKASRPPQVAAWQTPGGTARPMLAPVVAERLMDTGVPGTEVTRIRVTAPNGTDWTDRYTDTPHKATEPRRTVTTPAERRALSTALAAPAAPVTSAADVRRSPALSLPTPEQIGRYTTHQNDTQPTEAARADRLAAAPRHGTPKKPSSRKRPRTGSTGPTVPAHGITH